MIRILVCALGFTCLPSGTGITTSQYTFMEVGVKDASGNPADEEFFLGPLPTEGQAVEMVYVGRDVESGNMRFQLRVRN